MIPMYITLYIQARCNCIDTLNTTYSTDAGGTNCRNQARKVTLSSLFRRFRAACITIVAALTVIGTMPAASAAEIVVFAAASLKEALDDAVNVYENKSGDAVKISYAASSTLAKQIERGAPADIFISADLDWMDLLGALQVRQYESIGNLQLAPQ